MDGEAGPEAVMRLNEWHGNKWKENKVCDQVWARDLEPDKCFRLGAYPWSNIRTRLCNRPKIHLNGKDRAKQQIKTKRTGDRRTNTSRVGRQGMMSTCPEFGVSNLESARRSWPLNTSVQHWSLTSHHLFLSVICKIPDLDGSCDHAFTH